MKNKIIFILLICFLSFGFVFAAFDKQQIIEKISNKYIDLEKFNGSFTLDLNINMGASFRKSQITFWKYNDKFRLDYVLEKRERSIIFDGKEYIFYNQKTNIVNKINLEKIAKLRDPKVIQKELQKENQSSEGLSREQKKYLEEFYVPGINKLLNTLYDTVFLSPSFFKYDDKIIKERITKGPMKGTDIIGYVRYPITEIKVKEQLDGGKIYYIFTKEDMPIDLGCIEALFDDKYFRSIIEIDKKEQIFKKALFWIDANTYSVTKTELFNNFGWLGIAVNDIAINLESPPGTTFEFYIPRDAIVNDLSDSLLIFN